MIAQLIQPVKGLQRQALRLVALHVIAPIPGLARRILIKGGLVFRAGAPASAGYGGLRMNEIDFFGNVALETVIVLPEPGLIGMQLLGAPACNRPAASIWLPRFAMARAVTPARHTSLPAKIHICRAWE